MQAARGTPLTGPPEGRQDPGPAPASPLTGPPDGGHGPGPAPASPLTGPPDGGHGPDPARPGPPASGGGHAANPPRRLWLLLAIAVGVLVLDIVTKITVVATLSRRPVVLLGGFLTLRVSRNPGAAFSIGTSLSLVYTAIAVGVIVVILRTARRIRSLSWAITLGLLLGGATGNLADRLFRYPGPLRGWVVDWIQVPHWPVFNLADSAITCGGVLAVLLALRGIGIDGSRIGSRAKPAQDGPAGE
jgi:signal peptidase II